MTSALGSEVREYAWRVQQGAQERLKIPILDADGAPKDITGYVVDAKIKDEPRGTVLHTWTAADIDIVGTELTLTIPAPVSVLWNWSRGWYRVKLTPPGSPPEDPAVSRVLQGAIFLDFD